MNKKMDNAMRKATKKLLKMPRKKFMKMLDKHKDGDIAKIALEHLKAKELELATKKPNL